MSKVRSKHHHNHHHHHHRHHHKDKHSEYNHFVNLTPEEREEEYRVRAKEAYDRAWELYCQTSGWKLEYGTDDIEGCVHSQKFPHEGKIFRLQGLVDMSPQDMFKYFQQATETTPDWNDTVVFATTLERIDNYIDVTYHVTSPAAAGLVGSREFVNLRCWYMLDDVIFCPVIYTEHPAYPHTKKFIRGCNGPGGWMLKSVPGKPNKCILMWILNIDFKGWVPQGLLDSAMSGFLMDYLKNIRARIIVIKKGGD